MEVDNRSVALIFLLIVTVESIYCSELVADGTVLELDESAFDSAISIFDYVLVDFYAPWCGHCKRLSPQLDEAAPVLAKLVKPVVVAKVNADKYKRFVDKYEIDGFPTLKVFIHGDPVDYSGPRKADSIVQHLKKLIAPEVSFLESDEAVNSFVQAAGSEFPIFIGFEMDKSLLMEFARKYKKAWFSVVQGFSGAIMNTYDFDKVPALVSLYPKYNERHIFYGPFEGVFLEEFVKQNMLPLTVPVRADILQLLMDDKRNVVLVILEDETDQKSLELVGILRSVAPANRDFIFAYVGVKQFEDFIEPFGFDKKTKLTKILVWAKGVEYFQVVGLETLEWEDQASQVSRFLEGYREGRMVTKKFNAPSFMGYLVSLANLKTTYILVFLVMVLMVLQHATQENGTPNRGEEMSWVDEGENITPPEGRLKYHSTDKED